MKRLIDSIDQDIMFNATSGKVKTVKHIQVGMFSKRETGSKEIVICMNRLGHSLCYSELLELETNIAKKESSTNSQDYIPNKLKKKISSLTLMTIVIIIQKHFLVSACIALAK